MNALAERAWTLLNQAQEVYADSPRATNWLRRHLARFSEPLRLAVVGAPGAGATTLVGALAGGDAAGGDGRPMSWHYVPAEGNHPELALLDASSGGHSDEALALESVEREADAVLYLAGHPHNTDLSMLRAVSEYPPVRTAGVNTLLVLSRADELGGARVDALVSARQVARRWARDTAIGAVSQDAVAVAGLAACGTRSMSDDEFELLVGLASAPKEQLDPVLLSAARFGADPARARLLNRFGLFGVRVATTLLRQGQQSPAALAAELRKRSGLEDLWDAISGHFVERALALKARSALLGLDVVLRSEPRPAAAPLVTELERTLAGAHELNELRLLASLRSGRVRLPGELWEGALRLAGGYGTTAGVRLGMDADEPQLRQAAAGALHVWRAYSHSPVFGAAQRHVADTLARTCEKLLTEPVR